MRFGTKALITAALVAPAAAALIMTGAGTASAAVTTTTAHTTSSTRAWGPFCNQWQQEQWNLNGYNTVDATFEGGNYYYSVHFTQRGGCLSGTLTDSGYPSTGPISGTVSGDHVTFTFRYPWNSIQGTRTFVGTIDRYGNVYGYWYESGSEQGHGTWSLANRAHRACQRYEWWAPNRACNVYW